MKISKGNLLSKSKLKWTVGILGVVGLLTLGAMLFWGMASVVHLTNDTNFCISCHEMKENNFAEYSQTIHAKNRTGVQASCSDCHVPHDTIGLLKRKVLAANDVWHHLLGTIDTPEKFEQRRSELASRVWQHMKSTDSQECRSCHNVQAMDPDAQGPTARKQHRKMQSEGKTCIDCHYGIAHHEPNDGTEPSDIVVLEKNR